jgi:phosphoribosylaminoimidazole-succinocarboxamide synthase
MKKAIKETNFNFPNQTDYYRGKVRDVYYLDNKIVVIASDRISAFDHILPKAIPYKGQILNGIAAHFLHASQDIVPNWLESVPHPNVSIGKKAEPIKLEMVVRGYLAGHAWREYNRGERILCGVTMPEGMKEGDKFPEPIITPATKAEEGHDEDISEADILSQNIVTSDQWRALKEYSLALFDLGTQMAAEQGLILVDTKYEFGMYGGEIILIDEIHTPDSSRYYILDGYEKRQMEGVKQKQLSKEFVREWLMDNGFQGLEGQTMPVMPDSFVDTVTDRYIELYEAITGKAFDKGSYDSMNTDIENSVVAALK